MKDQYLTDRLTIKIIALQDSRYQKDCRRKEIDYDIWGDTVNVAAGMEQNGEDGKVNISEKTRELLTGEFSLTDRGSINAKNKGAMRMYFIYEAHVTA